MPDEKPPRAAWGMYQRVAVAGVLIVLFTAASVATAALLKVKDTLAPFTHAPVAKLRKDTITRAQAGQAQTILLVGSDRRYGWKRGESRSDTMMLLRLDPDQKAIGVLSVPRDLVVDIPGYGRAKINEAYTDGGLDLTTRTIKQVLGIDINHAIEVNFKGFRQAVTRLGCVYTDVDRRYYHSNAGLPPSAQYAEIDLQPGYQRLCGQKALDYVRFRHADTDLVRAARQQDFLRQAKDQIGTSSLIDNHDALIKIFANATEADQDLHTFSGQLRILRLAIFSAGHPLSEVEFPHTFVNSPTVRTAHGIQTTAGLGSYVTATPEQIHEAVQDFLHARAETRPKSTGKKASKASKKKRKKALSKAPASYARYGLIEARRTAEDLVAPALAKSSIDFPVYFPTALTPTATYPAPTTTPKAPNPRFYTLRDRAGRKHWAYRIVIAHNIAEGQYYGVQGTTWKDPPLLKHGGDPMRMRGRTYRLFYDGKRLRAVAWRTPKAVYWVSNTLSLQLTNKQMLGTARSLTRFGSG